ncbi:MAG: D-alanyl-D-alanine carboxypeptidase family protein [Candidatus Dojkabacteria bacterium]
MPEEKEKVHDKDFADVSQESVYSEVEKHSAQELYEDSVFEKSLNQRIITFLLTLIVTLLASLGVYIGVQVLTYKEPFVETATLEKINDENLAYGQLEELLPYSPAVASFPQQDDYDAQSMVIFDATANQEIFSKDADKQTLIASLTKLASTKILYDTKELGDSTIISAEAEEKEGSALELEEGQEFINEDLLKAAVIASSNQSVYALNNVEETIQLMNEYADALGLEDTQFSNPAGYDDNGNNYSSARDLIVLAKRFFHNEALRESAGTIELKIADVKSGEQFDVINTNDLLRLKTPGVLAGKTGTTTAAGQNLMLLIEKSGRQYIVVLLNSTDRYVDAYKVLDRLP